MTETKGSSGGEEVVLTRVLNAPRSLVFEAWTDPKRVVEWWGPDRFTNRLRKWDARPGGTIDLDMIAPDGSVFPMHGTFREVSESRLAFVSGAVGPTGKLIFEILNTITLTESGGKTTLTLHALVISQTEEAPRYVAGMEAGWTQSLARLDAHLTASSNGANR